MEAGEMQQLIADYAFGILNEDERSRIQKRLDIDPNARAYLAEYEAVINNLNFSVEPVELPVGSLDRLRKKAFPTQPYQTQTEVFSPIPLKAKISSIQIGRFNRGNILRWAAAFVLAFTTLAASYLWVKTQTEKTIVENNVDKIVGLLSAPDLQVIDLKPVGTTSNASIRLYSRKLNGKFFLSVKGLAAPPAGQVYEAWLISPDNKAHKAGVLDIRDYKIANLFELSINDYSPAFRTIAITIEKQGGADQPTSQPILSGSLSI